MKRPHGAPDISAARAADRLAELRADQSEVQVLRSKAARRRAVLTAIMLIAAVGGWVGVGAGLGIAALIVGGTGTVLTGLSLGLGRRAVVVGQRSDIARARNIAEEERRVQAATSYAARRRHAPTEVADFSENYTPVEATNEEGSVGQFVDRQWTPTPVPSPTYTMKASAPREAPGKLRRPEATSGMASGGRNTDVSPRSLPAAEIVSAAASGSVESLRETTATSAAQPVVREAAAHSSGIDLSQLERHGGTVPEVAGRDAMQAGSDTDSVETLSSMSVGEPSSASFTKAQEVAQQAAAKAAKEAARRIGAPSKVRSTLDLNAILEKRRASGE